jgi:hypothetical protein
MKQINLNKFIYGNDLNYTEEMEVLGMKFIKLKDGNYMIKDSNGVVVDEKEKLQLENRELVLEDVKSNKCQQETTKKIKKNKKRIKELEEFIPVETMDELGDVNGDIKETD